MRVGALRKDGHLRISHVITDGYIMGGAQINTLYSLKCQQREHEVELVVGNGGPLVDACVSAGIHVEMVPLVNRFVDPVRDTRALARLIRHFREWRPDVVHTHTSKAGMLGRVAAKACGVPVIVHTVHALAFQQSQPSWLQTGIKQAERLCTRITDKLVAVSALAREELLANGICDADKVCTIVSGIDFTCFPPDPLPVRAAVRPELGIPESTCVVISVGHLNPRKAHDLLIDAMAAIRPNCPDVYAVIVGGGALQESLQQRIDRQGLSDRVFLLGLRDDVPDLLAAADIFVQTSWHEGLSRSLVEAVYSRLPVIATDVNATREVVQDGVTGYLITPGDVRGLADRLLSLIENPAHRREMGARAHRSVAASRSVDAMCTSLDSLYRGLLAEKGRRSVSAATSDELREKSNA